jgi:flagellar hook-length control protein FliK
MKAVGPLLFPQPAGHTDQTSTDTASDEVFGAVIAMALGLARQPAQPAPNHTSNTNDARAHDVRNDARRPGTSDRGAPHSGDHAANSKGATAKAEPVKGEKSAANGVSDDVAPEASGHVSKTKTVSVADAVAGAKVAVPGDGKPVTTKTSDATLAAGRVNLAGSAKPAIGGMAALMDGAKIALPLSVANATRAATGVTALPTASGPAPVPVKLDATAVSGGKVAPSGDKTASTPQSTATPFVTPSVPTHEADVPAQATGALQQATIAAHVQRVGVADAQGASRGSDPAPQPDSTTKHDAAAPARLDTQAISLPTPAAQPSTPNVAIGSSAPTPPAPYAIPAQVVSVLSPLRGAKDGTYTLSLQLHPAELGPVTVRVAVNDGVLSIQLTADQQGGHDALHSSLSDLRSQLQASGLRVADVDVGAKAALPQHHTANAGSHQSANTGNSQQGSGQQGQQGQANHRQQMPADYGHGDGHPRPPVSRSRDAHVDATESAPQPLAGVRSAGRSPVEAALDVRM